MYASLGKISVVADEPEGQVAVQGDERDAHSIALAGEQAVLFALTRVINPFRAGFERVRMLFTEPPPSELGEIITAAGAEVEVMHGPRTPAARDDAATDATAARALRQVGADVLDGYAVEATRAGIEQLERLFRPDDFEPDGFEDSPEIYWDAALSLGAAVGEVLIRRDGGAWVRDPDFNSPIPWMVSRGELLYSVFSKVMRYFERGPDDAPSGLLDATAAHFEAPGRAMFNLRSPSWAGLHEAWSRPLVDRADELPGADVPHVTLVYDRETTVAALPPGDDARIAAHEADARANLAAVAVEMRLAEGDFPIAVVHGPEYAAEKVLDPAFMTEMQQTLGHEILLVGLPVKGVLLLSPMEGGPGRIGGFARFVAACRKGAGRKARLSGAVFVYAEGSLGVILPTPDPAAGRRRGFFSRLFRRG